MLCALDGTEIRLFPCSWRYYIESRFYVLCYSANFEPGIQVPVSYWLNAGIFAGFLEGGCMRECTREAHINRLGFYDVHKLCNDAQG